MLDDSSSDDMVELQSDPTVILDSGLSVKCEIFFKLLLITQPLTFTIVVAGDLVVVTHGTGSGVWFLTHVALA